MFAVVAPDKIQLPPGTVVRLTGNWQDYQQLCQQLGDRSIPRLKYRPGEILLMVPLPGHGRQANILADVVKVLLDHLDQEYEAFTPVTMDIPEVRGIEPDYCFYLDNWEAIAGKDRMDWENEPPPDLVIEIDVTSYTDVNDYLPYQVPEVWLLKKNKLAIYGLQDGQGYLLQNNSRYFPNLNILAIVAECLEMAYKRNTSAAIRMLRQKLNSQYQS